MRMGTEMVVGMALAGFLATAVAVAEELAAPATKVYLSMSPARIDVEFKPLLEFTPAVAVNPGGRQAWEAHVAEAVRGATEALAAEARQAIQASLGAQATLLDSPLTGVRPGDKMFGAALAALPFMQRRGTPVTLAVSDIVLTADHAGTVVNPNPRTTEKTGLLQSFANVGRSVANISGKKALTFEGATHLTYSMQYKLYATSTGELLREGKIGPLVTDTETWQGTWTFPAEPAFFETTCVNHVCDKNFSLEKASQHVTDPRPALLSEAAAKLVPQVKEAVLKSFSDWPDLIAAGQELAAKR